MAKTYRRVDRDQEFLLPPDMREWLPQEHLVWFLIAAVERMDTSSFHTKARLGGVGRRGYDPDMLLTLFVYAMAQGQSSSRQIERLCHTDVAFRVICAQDVPDHTVLARFRQKHEEALVGLLTESLVLAAELGMLTLGVVALDGTKIAANASKDANRTETTLRRMAQDYVAGAEVTDAQEDALFGVDKRGDELPPSTGDRTDRAGRIQRALGVIKSRRERSQEEQDTAEALARKYEQDVAEGTRRMRGKAPKGVDMVLVTRMRWERDRAEAAARYEAYQQALAAGRRLSGRPVPPPDETFKVRKAWAKHQAALTESAQAAEQSTDRDKQTETAEEDPRFRANLTDPDSRVLKTRNGWIQGLNCQTATSQDVFLLAARVTQATSDVNQFIPTKDAVEKVMGIVAERTGRADLRQIGTMLADAGYDTNDNLTTPGPDRLIADSTRRDLRTRAAQDPATGDPPEGASPREQMNHRLRTAEGMALYRRRSHLIEAPNAWLKDRRGLRQFARRGLNAAQAELSLAAAITNLLRIAAHGGTTAQLQNA